MALRIVCMCGYVIEGDDDDELWRNTQDHMGVLHPELVGVARPPPLEPSLPPAFGRYP
jgi:hypothetical protein